MKTRFLSAALAAMLFPAAAEAETETVDDVTWYYNTYEQDNVTYAEVTSGTDRYSGDLVVPSALGGHEVRRIGVSAFKACSGLTGITLQNGLVEVGESAFCSCTGLRDVSLPETLMSIGPSAFHGCTGLPQISIPNSVTNLGASVFSDCVGLLSAMLSRNLDSIPASCFYHCSSLASIEIPAGVETIGGFAFDGCKLLSDITLPEGLKMIGDRAFYDCNAFTRFDIPSTLEVAGDRMIGGCDDLMTITVAAGNMNCKVVNNCLVSYNGSTLLAVPIGSHEVDIPQGVTDIPAYMFYYARNLVRVTIPRGVISIGSNSFAYCSKLAYVDIPTGCTQIMGSAFYYCSSLKHVSLPGDLTEIGDSAFFGCPLAEIILPETLTSIGRNAISAHRVVFLGLPLRGIENSGLASAKLVSYPREYGAAWLAFLHDLGKFGGFNQAHCPEVEYVSVSVRENDPTILDVVYRVKSTKPSVKVRALAFKDGVRSFSNVVRPETFIEGTASNVGDSIAANIEHKLTWRVSADWAINLATATFEILAIEDDLLPLELVTIPANGSNRAMEISWNAINEAQVFDALLWLYADKTAGLALENGVLKDGSTKLVEGVTVYVRNEWRNWDGTGSYSKYFCDATDYVFSKMGFSPLSDNTLTYANAMTRLGLSPSGVRQYAYRWAGE